MSTNRAIELFEPAEKFEAALDEIDRLFLRTPHHVNGEHSGAGAQRVVQDMGPILRELLNAAFDHMGTQTFRAHSSQGAQNISQAIENISFHNFLSIGETQSGRVITGHMPVIRRSDLDRSKTEIDKLVKGEPFEGDIGRYILGRIVIAYRGVMPTGFPQLTDLTADAAFGAALYAARVSVPADVRSPRAMMVIASQISDTGAKITDIAETSEQLRSKVRLLDEDLSVLGSEPEKIKQQIDAYRAEAGNALTAFREEIGLNETRALWGAQAFWGMISYYTSLAFLVCAFVGGAIIVWAYSSELMGFLGEIESLTVSEGTPAPVIYALAIGRLILVTGPLLLLVWAAKLIVRFNMRSMLLMDDARQRVTMLNTYLFLVDRAAATVQDRGALLEAMFRRAPGHGPETIEPPNLTDIMKYGEAVGAPAK